MPLPVINSKYVGRLTQAVALIGALTTQLARSDTPSTNHWTFDWVLLDEFNGSQLDTAKWANMNASYTGSPLGVYARAERVIAFWLYKWAPTGTREIDIFEIFAASFWHERSAHTNTRYFNGDPSLESDQNLPKCRLCRIC